MAGKDPIGEKALVFGPQRSMVGIWTGPRSRVAGRPAVVMVNSGIIHRVGLCRLHTRLARMLAPRGFPSFRFDLSGIGDSLRRTGVSSLREAVTSDITAALDHLADRHHVNRFVIFGLCSGAHDAVLNALTDARLVGVIAIDLLADFRNWQHHAHHFRQRLFNATSWANALRGRNQYLRALRDSLKFVKTPVQRVREGGVGVRAPLPRETLVEMLDTLLGRDVRMLLMFSGGIEQNYNHRSQFKEALPAAARHPNLLSEYFPNAGHWFDDRKEQLAVIELITQWTDSNFGPDRESRRGQT